LQNPGEIRDIPDLDGTGEMTHGMGGIHLTDGSGAGKEKEVSEIPDLDDIPDMEEDLEGEDELPLLSGILHPPSLCLQNSILNKGV